MTDFDPRKHAGQMCFVWHCKSLGPEHPVTWKCDAGHRRVLLYCAPHAAEVTANAIANRGTPGPHPMCPQCQGFLYIATEGPL